MQLNRIDIESTVSRYTDRYRKYGYSPKTLGWDKGKQDLRFGILTAPMELEGASILDIGCGFGDAVAFIDQHVRQYRYLGIDLVPQLIEKARELHPQREFVCADFLSAAFDRPFDYAIGSGIFNFKLKENDNYAFIEAAIEKAMKLCTKAVAFDFLSDKVDYQYEHTFHSSPARIVDIAYRYSRNIVLRNDYMPFEFSLLLYKDASFDTSDTIFTAFKERSRLHHDPIQ